MVRLARLAQVTGASSVFKTIPFQGSSDAPGAGQAFGICPVAPPVQTSPKLAIVVPTYCEAENIWPLVRAVDNALEGHHWEIIFVDDNSPDGTIDRIRACASRDHRIRGLRRLDRRGLSGALIEGVLATSAEFVAVMDCDLQHDETLLTSMLDALRSGADLAIATRYDQGGSSGGGFTGFRQHGSHLATRLATRLIGTDVSDPMSGFFMMRRSAFEAIAPKLSTSGFKLLLDILASRRKPLRIAELPYAFRPRHAGRSKLNERVVIEFVALLISKATKDAVSPRFLLFAMVGATGIAVHLLALNAALAVLPGAFGYAQLAASYCAMLWNFILNNTLTYSDRRLRGWAAIKGFVSFALVCSIGTLANVGVAQLVYQKQPDWLLAGLAGALMAAVFNYSVTSVLTWRKA